MNTGIDQIINEAEIDMIACLEQAHKKYPDIPVLLLGNVKEVAEYCREIVSDVNNSTGQEYEIAFTPIQQADQTYCFVVVISLKGHSRKSLKNRLIV